MKTFPTRLSLLGWTAVLIVLTSVPTIAQPAHFVGVTADGKLWHTIRQANGMWQPFGDVSAEAGQLGGFSSAASAFDGSNLHVVALTRDGRIFHTIRYADGTWQRFGDVASQAGSRGAFVSVGVVLTGGNLQVIGTTADGRVWHTIRMQSGAWQPFGDVKAEAGDRGTFVTVGAGCFPQAATFVPTTLPRYTPPDLVPSQRTNGECGKCDSIDNVPIRSTSGDTSVRRATEAALRSLQLLSGNDPSWFDDYVAKERASSLGKTVEGQIFLRVNAIETLLKNRR